MSRRVSVTWGKDSPRRHGERREVEGMEEGKSRDAVSVAQFPACKGGALEPGEHGE